MEATSHSDYFVIGDEHATVEREADRVSDAAFRQRGEELRGHRARLQFPDGPSLLKIDDVEVSRGVDGGPLDSERVLSGACHLPALEKRGPLRRSAEQQRQR